MTRGAARDAGGPDPWHWPPDVGPILVIEDDEALRAVLVDAIAAAGHPVTAAPNGAAALEEVRRAFRQTRVPPPPSLGTR